ncbi:MAG TPA: hypothetical protein DHW14_07690 [Clostridiales bacterium]|nr:hypothetical protein [Clostridiales bacterium]
MGLAVDLGTANITGRLVDLATGRVVGDGTVPNPQSRFGQDVISRLRWALSSAESARRLREAAAAGINELAGELTARAGSRPGRVVSLTVVGNTAMHHLLAGLDVSRLAVAPHVPATTEPLDLAAADLGLVAAPGAQVHLVPCIAGFVGGDHAAVLLATGLAAYPGVAMAVDIGTNTEVTLTRRGNITCCSCASGPAFEGGGIARGMRAGHGAVERVRLEEGELRYEVIGGGEPLGFCGSAVVDLVACLREAGSVDRSGRMLAGWPHVVETGSGLEVRVGGVPFTQQDLRRLQLAKAAVRAGIGALLEETGTRAEEVERVYVAGSFGAAVDPASAVAVGLFPDIPLDRFVTVGNAAVAGACLCLVSRAERERASAVARSAAYLELASLPGYHDLFLSHLRLERG